MLGQLNIYGMDKVEVSIERFKAFEPKEALEWYERKRVEARAMADRDCNNCKHNKPEGCSRWDCEYEPVMSDLIKKSDAIKALYKYNFVSKNVIEREINAIPSADAVEVVRCKDCRHSRIEGDTTLFMWCGYWNKPTDGNRYCSDGERRVNAMLREKHLQLDYIENFAEVWDGSCAWTHGNK